MKRCHGRGVFVGPCKGPMTRLYYMMDGEVVLHRLCAVHLDTIRRMEKPDSQRGWFSRSVKTRTREEARRILGVMDVILS